MAAFASVMFVVVYPLVTELQTIANSTLNIPTDYQTALDRLVFVYDWIWIPMFGAFIVLLFAATQLFRVGYEPGRRRP